MSRELGRLNVTLIARMGRPALVTIEDGYFVFRNPDLPDFIYDFQIKDHADAVRWVAHLTEKNWVTVDHIRQFCALLRRQLGGF